MKEFNTPKHYVLSDGSDSMDALAKILGPEEFKGFLRGNALKYLIRYKLKGGIEDLRKAMDYVKRLAEVADEKEEKTTAELLFEACKKYKLDLNLDSDCEWTRNGDPVPMETELTVAYDGDVFFSVFLNNERDWDFFTDALRKIPSQIRRELMEICMAYGETPIKDRGDIFSFS